MSLIHWNYFLSLEEDLKGLSRYIEFHTDNIYVYSIELAKIIMGATGEVDVLMKQLCLKHGNKSSNETGYRSFIPTMYPNIISLTVFSHTTSLEIQPFSDWRTNTTPTWRTANNKIKHHRNTDFKKANLNNAFSAMGGLLLANIYFYCEIQPTTRLFPNPSFLDADQLVVSISPTSFGNINNYKLPNSNSGEKLYHS